MKGGRAGMVREGCGGVRVRFTLGRGGAGGLVWLAC